MPPLHLRYPTWGRSDTRYTLSRMLSTPKSTSRHILTLSIASQWPDLVKRTPTTKGGSLATAERCHLHLAKENCVRHASSNGAKVDQLIYLNNNRCYRLSYVLLGQLTKKIAVGPCLDTGVRFPSGNVSRQILILFYTLPNSQKSTSHRNKKGYVFA